MFKISFLFSNKIYSGKVQKINQEPIKFVVWDITPGIGYVPEKLVYISNPDSDQLIYQSFDITHAPLLRSIGEAIFITCHEQKIAVHQ